jgi:hypothetical protein
MDPTFHTAAYVHKSSFTLFSVICALGSAVSGRARDRHLSTLLYSMAEKNIKWSILNSVKSLEIIQAIINITYWARCYDNYTEDPSWLHFGHVRLITLFALACSSTNGYVTGCTIGTRTWNSSIFNNCGQSQSPRASSNR